MKLLCETNIVRRSNREIKSRYVKSTLAIGKKDEKSKLCMILITTNNKSGTKYDLTNNLAGIFRKFVDDGKCTISFILPEIDLLIKADSIQLKAFLNVMKSELCPKTSGKSELPKNDNKLIRAFGSTNKMIVDEVSKLNITKRSDFPTKGLPRTLKELTITGIGCLQMPIGILNLTKLTYLDLTGNKIEKLHRAIGNLSINQLILSDNQFGNSTNLKDWEWLTNGRNIQLSLHTLIISKNMLRKVPVALAKCENLVLLDLSFNDLATIPFSFKQLKRLKVLNLSNNKLSSLPCTIIHLYLDVIDLSNNQFPSYTHSLEISQNSLASITAHNFKFPTLLELASRIVMKRQMPFMSLNIPHIVKEILFHSPNCLKCGSFVFDRTIYKNIKISTLYAKSRITSDNASHFLIDGPFCKITCLNSK